MKHLALIMDGNRRWAKKQGLMPWLGHKQGVSAVRMAIQYCLDHNISYLSLYTFSLENFKRSQQEISYLFSLLGQAQEHIAEFIKEGVQIRFVGDRSMMPSETLKTCQDLERMTENGHKLLCNFLLCYGGQQEILAAVQAMLDQKLTIALPADFKKCLWLGDIAEPDLIIRTGGVKRLSNFLLFQAAYAEIRFLDCLWPDLTKDLLHQTVCDALQAQKNEGK